MKWTYPINSALNDESAYFKRRREDTDRFVVARDGDWFSTPFQCEVCNFRNCFGVSPVVTMMGDEYLCNLIRRANLDMFWSREATTIRSQFGRVKEIIKRQNTWGRECRQLLPPLYAHPTVDESGMTQAMMMLEKSREKGRNAAYTQFDTVRQLRTTISNIYTGSSDVRVDNGVLKSRKGDVLHIHEDPMQSVFMERFMVGLQHRMPSDAQRDTPLLGHVVAGVLEEMRKEMRKGETDASRKRLLTMCGGYMAVTYSYSLRGNEGFWVDGDRLQQYLHLGQSGNLEIPHVAVALLGRFKSEGGDRMHVFTLANETKSGVKNRWWLERVARILAREEKTECPAFCDKEGYMLRSQDVEKVFQPILKDLQKTNRFGNDIPAKLDIEKSCRCFRSFRRGAENTALRNGVDKDTIKFVHRWSTIDRRGGSATGFDMVNHYADGTALRPKMLKFTSMI